MSYLIWFWFFCFFPRTPNITNTIHPYTTFSALITCIAIQVEDSPITYKSFIQNKRRQNYFTFHFHFFFFHYHFKSNIGESYLRSLLLSKINSLGMDWDWMDQNLAPFPPPPPPPLHHIPLSSTPPPQIWCSQFSIESALLAKSPWFFFFFNSASGSKCFIFEHKNDKDMFSSNITHFSLSKIYLFFFV